LVIFRDLELKTSGKGKSLSDFECCEEHVILHNVGSVLLESLFVDRDVIVESNISGQLCAGRRGHSVRQDIEKTGFAGAGRAHNESSLTWGSKA